MTADHTFPVGASCRECHRDEAKCAKEFGCCASCTHFRHLDANGNPYDGRAPQRLRRDIHLTPIHTARRAALDRAIAAWQAEQAQKTAPGVRQLMPHGTHAAFIRHRLHKTEPCTDCWEAERTYQRERKRAVRRRGVAS